MCAGTLLAEGGELVAAAADLKELIGIAEGIGCVSEAGSGAEAGTGALLLCATGRLDAAVDCSLATSARGVRGCFGWENIGAVTTGLGASRV